LACLLAGCARRFVFSPAFLEVLWFVFSSTCFKFRENLKQVEVMGLCAIAVA
jgi:hypothetical protein